MNVKLTLISKVKVIVGHDDLQHILEVKVMQPHDKYQGLNMCKHNKFWSRKS